MDVSGFFNYPTADAPETPELDFFSHGTEEEWGRLLSYTETQLFDAGETVMREGDGGNALYLLTDGTLEVIGQGQRGPWRTLVPIAVFGELSFIDGLPRPATLRAVTDGEMLRLGREAFDSLCAREPRLGQAILFEIGRSIALRLRRAESRHDGEL